MGISLIDTVHPVTGEYVPVTVIRSKWRLLGYREMYDFGEKQQQGGLIRRTNEGVPFDNRGIFDRYALRHRIKMQALRKEISQKEAQQWLQHSVNNIKPRSTDKFFIYNNCHPEIRDRLFTSLEELNDCYLRTINSVVTTIIETYC
jgi:hypothetical protein